MPEIKNTFSQGKMNKDLDERLIQNGSYRDALNVDVTSSEESNAGTVQNILGNTSIEGLIGGLNGYTCVGSVPDETTNKLYWLVSGIDKDAIVEYDASSSISRFIAVDISKSNNEFEAFLNFSGSYISGINIIDEFLFWTDGENEPKRINVRNSSQQDPLLNINEQNHARLFVDENDIGPLQTEHVTVVKRKPSTAPFIELKNLQYSNQEPIFEKILPRFCFRYKYKDGEYSAFGPFTEVAFNPEYQDGISSNNAYFTDEPYNKAMSNFISSVCIYDFVPCDIPEDVVQVDILYKQENSNVVYSIANIKKDSEEWNELGSSQLYESENTQSTSQGKYVITSESIHAALPSNQLLRPWDNVPKKALSQEIIGNRVVYGNYSQGYDLETKPKLLSDFEYRGLQDFTKGGLRTLKSQRDYQVGVVVGDEYGRETPVFTSTKGSVRIQWSDPELGKNASNSLMFKSSLQDYLPEWASYYKFYVKETSSEYYNLIMDKAYIPPKHIDYRNTDNHIWISFPSSDRNKLMEDDFIIAKKAYNNSDPTQVAYENKFQVLDIKNEAPDAVRYIFTNLGVVDNGVTAETIEGDIIINFDPEEDNPLFPDQDKSINAETDIIHLHKTRWFQVDGAPLVAEEAGVGESNSGVPLVFADTLVKDVYISWELPNDTTETATISTRYKVSSVRISNGNVYVLKLSTKISAGDKELADNWPAALNFKIERRDARDPEDFSGKFFVKIKSDDSFTTIQSSGIIPLDSMPSFWLYDEHTDGNSQLDGIVNSNTSTVTPPENTDQNELASNYGNSVAADGDAIGVSTESEWQALLDSYNTNPTAPETMATAGGVFFIDNMQFVASNPSDSNFAKESGEGWAGAYTMYDKFNWGGVQTPAAEDIFDTTNVVYGWGTSQDSLTNVAAQGGFANFTTSFGGHGLAPRIQSTSLANSNTINGLEGVVTSSNSHVFGARQWLRSSIYDRFLTDDTYSAEGKYYIHLSFLAPGVDLHNGIWGIEYPNVWGSKSHARDMQGIWGGGIFTKTPTSENMDENGFVNLTPWTNSDDMLPPGVPDNFFNQVNWVEFEGSYSSAGDFGIALETSPEDQGVAGGYNPAHAEKHFNQWNAAYLGDGQEDPNIAAFLDQIQTGNQFIFAGDTSEEIYTIQDVTEVKLYNHTPWRMKWIWDGEQYAAGGNSVEEAASAWADTWSLGGNAAGEADALATLRERIKHFGQANNRRICYVIEVDKDPASQTYNIADDASNVNAFESTRIQFIDTSVPSLNDTVLSYPTIWETEPSQVEELNIYHEASSNIPTRITGQDREIFAPIGCEVKLVALPNANNDLGIPDEDAVGTLNPSDIPQDMRIVSWNEGQSFTIEPGLPQLNIQGNPANYNGALFKFIRHDNSYTIGRIDMPIDNWSNYIDGLDGDTITEFTISEINDVTLDVGLNWYNAFSFGDGVESNRIRDAFNEMRITNGARVSATLEEPYSEENRKSGLIYSGIYNSDSGVNNLNQFIQAEKITKDLNPTYGSIQKLFSRNTDLVALCEDRILKILANKDALFNADGNPQLVATERVLGQAVPFVGDYGISQNPESFAYDSYRAYFTDKQRGAVLRLSMDGLTPISDAGMRDWFRDNLRDDADLLGTYDGYSKHYNITIKPIPYDNIIQNSSISGGTELEQLPAPDDIIINGSLAQGGSSVEPTTLAELFVDQPNINVPVFNRELNSVTEVQHYHPIPLGSLNNVFDVVVGQTGVDATDAAFAIIPHNISGDAYHIEHYHTGSANAFNSNIGFGGVYYTRFTYSDDLGTLANPIDPNNLSLGTQLGNISDTVPGNGGYAEVNIYDSGAAYPSIFVENGDQIDAGLYPTEFYDDDTPSSGITFRSTPDHNGKFGYIVTNYVQGTDINNNVPDGISEWAAEQSETVNNNTMLNGEEIYISFNVQYNHHGVNPTNIRITLLDGAGDTINNVVDNSLIIQPDNLYDQSDPSTYWTNQAFDFDEQLPPNFAADVNNPNILNRRGFVSVSEVEFPGVSAGALNGNYNHSAFFKFSNGTEDTSVVVQDLKVKIEVFTDPLLGNPNIGGGAGTQDLQDFTELVLMNFKVHKVFKQNKANTPAIPAIEAQNPFPSEDIPGWARVIHNDPEYWSTPNASLLVQNVNLYGDTTPLFENTDPATGLSYFVPAPQSGTNVLGEPFPQYDSSFDTGQGNIFDSQFISVNGHAYLQPLESITHIFQNEFSFQQDRWYAIDIKATLASALSTGTTEFVLGNFSANPPDWPTSELVLINQDNGGAYEAEETTSGYERHRIVFKASSNGLQQPGAFTLLDPENVSRIVIMNAGNNNRTIDSVTVFDITDEVEPGFAENWDIELGQQYFDAQNILQEPNLTYGPVTPNTSQNYIAWNGEVGFPQAFAQDFDISPQATEDGYEFKFQVLASPFNPLGYDSNTNIHDTLQFSVLNNEGQGFLCRIDFDNLNVNGVHVKVKFNFDGSTPEVLADLPNTPTGVFESIGNAVTALQTSGVSTLWGKVRFQNVGPLNAGVYNISLQDITEYFTASTIPNWVIPEDQEFITYDNSYGGQISFNESPEDVIIYQSIQLQPGFSYTLSYDHNITEGSICGYYLSPGNGYTTFEILPNSPNSQIITINSGYPEAGEIPMDFPHPQANALVFYSCEGNLTGTLDNITLVRRATLFAPTTVSFNEDVRGWVSFKSFIPESGLSVSNQYYTMFNGGLYQHNTGDARNRFYEMVYPSTVTTVLNMDPSLVKSFKTINYEGSQARVRPYVEITNADGDVVNNLSAYNAFTGAPEPGWYTESIITDLQEGYISEFIKKEGKWFNYIKGLNSGIETKDLNFQGLGVAQSIDYPE